MLFVFQLEINIKLFVKKRKLKNISQKKMPGQSATQVKYLPLLPSGSDGVGY